MVIKVGQAIRYEGRNHLSPNEYLLICYHPLYANFIMPNINNMIVHSSSVCTEWRFQLHFNHLGAASNPKRLPYCSETLASMGSSTLQVLNTRLPQP